MANKLNAGALAAALRGGLRRLKAGEKLGPTDEQIHLEAVLNSPAFKAAVADLEADLGQLDAKARRSLAGARNSTEVLRRLQKMGPAAVVAPSAPGGGLTFPTTALNAAQLARINGSKIPLQTSWLNRITMNRQSLFRLAQRGPSQLISSLFGSNNALGLGGATLAGIAAVKAVTEAMGLIANYREFKRQGNSATEALRRTANSAVQKIASGILNITGVSSGAGDVAALIGGTDTESARKAVRDMVEEFFQTSKERREHERDNDRQAVKARSEELARQHSQYLKTAQSYFDAAPVSDYTIIASLKSSLGRLGNEARTAVRDIFNRPVWNVVRRAAVEGAH